MGHAVGCAVALGDVIARNPYYVHTIVAHHLGKLHRLTLDAANQTRCYGEVVVAIVSGIFFRDYQNLHVTALQPFAERDTLLSQGVVFVLRAVCVRIAYIDVAGHKLGLTGLGKEAVMAHGYQVMIDNIEPCIQVHLRLREEVVAYHYNGIVAEEVVLKQLVNSSLRGTHTAAYERYGRAG